MTDTYIKRGGSNLWRAASYWWKCFLTIFVGTSYRNSHRIYLSKETLYARVTLYLLHKQCSPSGYIKCRKFNSCSGAGGIIIYFARSLLTHALMHSYTYATLLYFIIIVWMSTVKLWYDPNIGSNFLQIFFTSWNFCNIISKHWNIYIFFFCLDWNPLPNMKDCVWDIVIEKGGNLRQQIFSLILDTPAINWCGLLCPQCWMSLQFSVQSTPCLYLECKVVNHIDRCKNLGRPAGYSSVSPT